MSEKRDRNIGESKTYALKIELEDLEQAHRIAKILGTTTAKLIRSALRSYLEKVEGYVDDVEKVLSSGKGKIQELQDMIENKSQEISPDGIRTDEKEDVGSVSDL